MIKIDTKIELFHTYIKDLSIELLDPVALLNNKNDPNFTKIDISPLMFKHRELNENTYELVAECKILITQKDKKILGLQIEYSGLFIINNSDNQDNLNKFLYVDCANILYPFLRAQVANLTLNTGTSPVILPFVNFEEQFHSMNKN